MTRTIRKPTDDAGLPTRQGAGLKEEHLLRNIDSQNEVVLLFEAKDLQKAREWAAQPIYEKRCRTLEWLISRIFTFSANREVGRSDRQAITFRVVSHHRVGYIVKRARIESWCVQIRVAMAPGCANGSGDDSTLPMNRRRAVISAIIRILRGFA